MNAEKRWALVHEKPDTGGYGGQSPEVTKLLEDWQNGDQRALDRLMPIVYDELRRIAARYLHSERSGHTLQTTALVHEAYLRLVDGSRTPWQGRAHFFAVAATLIRNILVDHARTQKAAKRGGGASRLPLEEALAVSLDDAPAIDAVDDALKALAKIDLQQSRIVELRFFGGLTIAETAEVLEISESTVKRDWIYRALSQSPRRP